MAETTNLGLHIIETNEVVSKTPINENMQKIDEAVNVLNKNIETISSNTLIATSTGTFDYDIWGTVKVGSYIVENKGDISFAFVGIKQNGSTNLLTEQLSPGAKWIIDVTEEMKTSGYYTTSVGNVALELTPIRQSVSSITGKTIMTFGDSFTASKSYYLNNLLSITGLKLLKNYAVSGATLTNYEDTVMNGETSIASGNTVPNQVFKMLSESVEQPDIIIIFASTNDQISDFDFEETNYQVENNWVDIDTLNLDKSSAAMRWIVEKIKSKYTTSTIYFVTPTQAATKGNRTFLAQKTKADYIIQSAERMSIPVIDLFRNSGIYERFEINNGNGIYLKDGLHPNNDGGLVIAEYMAKQLNSN